jgi:hypothetical protein
MNKFLHAFLQADLNDITCSTDIDFELFRPFSFPKRYYRCGVKNRIATVDRLPEGFLVPHIAVAMFNSQIVQVESIGVLSMECDYLNVLLYESLYEVRTYTSGRSGYQNAFHESLRVEMLMNEGKAGNTIGEFVRLVSRK